MVALVYRILARAPSGEASCILADTDHGRVRWDLSPPARVEAGDRITRTASGEIRIFRTRTS